VGIRSGVDQDKSSQVMNYNHHVLDSIKSWLSCTITW